jgi:uncharacterized protein (TIGR03435 family)
VRIRFWPAWIVCVLWTSVLVAQGATGPQRPVPSWEAAAGGPQAFDVVSIQPNHGDDEPYVNVPYGADDNYTSTGGIFRAVNWPVVRLITFAYKGAMGQQREAYRASLPGWAISEGFNIDARSDNHNPTKDQMRLMVRSMLEERFRLHVHNESRSVSAYAVMLIKPGVLGPQLRPHPADASCGGSNAAVRSRSSEGEQPSAPSSSVPPPAAAGPNGDSYGLLAGGFPVRCGSFVNMPPTRPYLRHEGARDMTMAQIVAPFPVLGSLGRPVVDQTGLTGTFDWVMEFIDEREGHTPPPDAEGLTFVQALAQQNGLKLVSSKTMTDVFLVDHLEHPTEN